MSDDDERRAAFVRLQPICSRLLQDRTNARNVGQSLDALRDALNSVSDRGLRGCQEYVLFPLLLIVDSIAVSALPAGSGRVLLYNISASKHIRTFPHSSFSISRMWNITSMMSCILCDVQDHPGALQCQLLRQTELQNGH